MAWKRTSSAIIGPPRPARAACQSPEHDAPCEPHGLIDCATCHHCPGECGFGACHAPAAVTLHHDTGRDARAFCQRHATDPAFAFARAGFRLALCPACVACIGGACAGPDLPWRPARPGEPCGASDCAGRAVFLYDTIQRGAEWWLVALIWHDDSPAPPVSRTVAGPFPSQAAAIDAAEALEVSP